MAVPNLFPFQFKGKLLLSTPFSSKLKFNVRKMGNSSKACSMFMHSWRAKNIINIHRRMINLCPQSPIHNWSLFSLNFQHANCHCIWLNTSKYNIVQANATHKKKLKWTRRMCRFGKDALKFWKFPFFQ